MDWCGNWLLKKNAPRGVFFKVQSSEFKVQILCRIRDGIIYWIATVAALPRDESEYVKTSNSAV